MVFQKRVRHHRSSQSVHEPHIPECDSADRISKDPIAILRVGVSSEDIGNVVFTLVLASEVTNTWRRAFIAASNERQWTRAFVKASASIVAVVTNASVAPCAPQNTCLSIAVAIRSRLSDPVPLSDLTVSHNRSAQGIHFHCPQGSWERARNRRPPLCQDRSKPLCFFKSS